LSTITIKLPSLGESVDSGTIISLLVSPGEFVSLNQTILEVETDKVTAEVPCDAEGTIVEIMVQEGDEIAEGDAILTIESSRNTDAAKVVEPEVKTSEPIQAIEEITVQTVRPVASEKRLSPRRKDNSFRATPKARKLSRELGIEISRVSFIGDVIVEADIKAHIRNVPHDTAPRQKQLDISHAWGDVTKVKMSGIMKATATNMAQAWQTIPHAWLTEDIDITALEEQRKILNAEQEEIKLSTTVFIVKCVSKSLQKYTIFNASVDMATHEIIYRDRINIGVAVDTDHGLFVPVIKDTQQMGLNDIGHELSNLGVKAKAKKLSMGDLEGGGFTISNLGTIGSTSIFPIINAPQVAILGVARYKLNHLNQKILTVTLGFDHRVINGADAARFLQQVKYLMESPVRILA